MEDGTQIIRLGGEHPYLLSHLISPVLELKGFGGLWTSPSIPFPRPLISPCLSILSNVVITHNRGLGLSSHRHLKAYSSTLHSLRNKREGEAKKVSKGCSMVVNACNPSILEAEADRNL